MFKLLALRVLDGCAIHIRKCLKENVYYYFCTDYRFEIKDRVYRGSRYTKPLYDSFFTPVSPLHFGDKKKYIPTINLNAIVGMNGDGKSTIVELIIRLVNNYIAKHLRSQHSVGIQPLLPVSGVCAELFFQIDDTIYRLYSTQKSDGLLSIADISELQNSTDSQYVLRKVNPAPAKILEHIYTLVSNYSHYAYNAFDFKKEWVYVGDDILNEETQNKVFWMHRIFHKNDGYITPLSIHPYRITGNIDINRETLLSKQRLLYLFVKSSDEPNAFRNILGKRAIGIRLTPTTANKLFTRAINNFFICHNGDDYSLDWALEPLRKDINNIKKVLSRKKLDLDQLQQVHYALKHLSESYIKDVQNSLERILLGSEWLQEQREMYRTFQSRTIRDIDKKAKVRQSNIKKYVTLIRTLVHKLEEQLEMVDDSSRITMLYDYLPDYNILDQIANYQSYNLQQIARLHTIFSLAIRYQFDPKILYDKPFNKLSNKERAQLYKIYKTLSIFETYPKYKEIIQEGDKKWGVDSTYEYSPHTLSRLFSLLNDDMDAESHITRKLVQTNNYLSMSADIYKDEPDLDIDYHPEDSTSKIKSISSIAHYYGADNVDLFHLIPPVFDFDIVLQDGGSYMEFETLSSGEKQLLNNIGAIIYHLLNIDSSYVEYHSVNLILEEIELYFHPDFQRKLINRMVEQIYGIRWKRIKNINITIVTHSPFVLSDIPKSNVLFLKDGIPDYDMQENTFGANIHSLLKNGFFLPNLPMGEFAYQKINEIFRKLNDNQFNEEDIEEMKQEISVIGEPYLKEQLLKLLRANQL